MKKNKKNSAQNNLKNNIALDKKENPTEGIAYYVIFLLITAYIIKPYFTSGHTYSLDGAIHALKTLIVYKSLKAGEFPLWMNCWNAGQPDIQFYSPIYYYLSGTVNLLFDNLLFTTKLMCFLAHILSGLAAFWLVWEVTGNRRAGFLGGLVYAISPWHLFHIMDFCRFPVSLIYTVMPLPFLFFERYRHGKSSLFPSAIWIGLALGLMVCIHIGYTAFIIFLLSIYVILNALSRKKPFVDIKPLLLLTLSGVVCLLTSFWFMVPFVLENKRLAGDAVTGLIGTKKFTVDSATWDGLISRRATPVGHQGYIGLSFFCLALAGLLYAIWKKKYPLIAMFLFSIYLVLGYDTALYQFIPLVYSQQATYRLIMYWVLFMALLAGYGYLLIEEWLAKAGCYKEIIYLVFATLAGIFVFDASVVIDRHWPSAHGMESAYEAVNEASAKNKLGERALQICDQENVKWMFAVMFPGVMAIETPTPVVWARSFPVKADAFNETGIQWVRQELQTLHRADKSQEFLYLLNIAHLVYVTPQGGISILKSPSFSPVFASGEVEYLKDKPEPAAIPSILDNMGLDFSRNLARKIYLMPDTSSQPANWTANPVKDDIKLDIHSYRQTMNRTFLDVEANHDCFLHISHSFYEFLQIYLDDKPVDYRCTATGLIAIQFPQGKHRIVITPIYSLLRTICLWVSLVSVLLMVGIVMVKGKG